MTVCCRAILSRPPLQLLNEALRVHCRDGVHAEAHANGVADCNGSGDADMAEADAGLDYQMLFRRGREVFDSMETKGELSPPSLSTHMHKVCILHLPVVVLHRLCGRSAARQMPPLQSRPPHAKAGIHALVSTLS